MRVKFQLVLVQLCKSQTLQNKILANFVDGTVWQYMICFKASNRDLVGFTRKSILEDQIDIDIDISTQPNHLLKAKLAIICKPTHVDLYCTFLIYLMGLQN